VTGIVVRSDAALEAPRPLGRLVHVDLVFLDIVFAYPYLLLDH
jgi:hypothetical protein